MLENSPLTALGTAQPEMMRIGDFTIMEDNQCAMASLAARLGGEEQTIIALSRLIGGEVPQAGQYKTSQFKTGQYMTGQHMTGQNKNSHSTAGHWAIFWTGPEQWMAEAPFASHEDITAILSKSFAGIASITEQTDGWCRFLITGPDMAGLVALLCAVDMRGFSKGSAVRTIIEHIGCFLLQSEDGNWLIIGPRSSAQSLHHTIITAMKSLQA